MPRMARVTLEEPVRTFQIDVNEHVSNIAYVQWLEIARVALLAAAGLPAEGLRARGRRAIVVETWIKHHDPLVFPDRVAIRVWVSELTHVSIWLDFELRAGTTGRLAARARQRVAFVDGTSNRPQRLSDGERESLAGVSDPEPGA